MSFVSTQPEALTAAAGVLQGLGDVRPERGRGGPNSGDSRGRQRDRGWLIFGG